MAKIYMKLGKFKTLPPKDQALAHAKEFKGEIDGRKIVGIAPPKVKVPEPPTRTQTNDERAEYDEQQVYRTELLMTKGVKDKRQLMTLLGVTDPKAMERYINRVYARWEMMGSFKEYQRLRGEGVRRLEIIENELWSTISNNDDDRIKIVALRSILDVQKYRDTLQGMTDNVIERISSGEMDRPVLFTKRLATHDTLALVASRMLEMIEQRSTNKISRRNDAETIDLDPTR